MAQLLVTGITRTVTYPDVKLPQPPLPTGLQVRFSNTVAWSSPPPLQPNDIPPLGSGNPPPQLISFFTQGNFSLFNKDTLDYLQALGLPADVFPPEVLDSFAKMYDFPETISAAAPGEYSLSALLQDGTTYVIYFQVIGDPIVTAISLLLELGIAFIAFVGRAISLLGGYFRGLGYTFSRLIRR